MKRTDTKNAYAGGIIFLLFFSSIFHVLYSSDHYFSFDTLFPKNNFAKATEQCMQVWGAFDQIIKSGVPSLQSLRSLDRSIGQLVLSQHYLRNSKEEQSVDPERCSYLARVVGTLSDRYNNLQHIDDDRAACLKQQIDAIKQLVESQLTNKK